VPWINRKEFTRLLVADAKREAAETQLKITQGSFDWLRTMFNSMSNDRDALARQVGGLRLPTPQIHGRAAEIDTKALADYLKARVALSKGADAEKALEAALKAANAEEPTNAALKPQQLGDNDPTALEGLEGMGAGLWEDMGDTAAARFGLAHDLDGNVVDK
jgi:hypothetical protein